MPSYTRLLQPTINGTEPPFVWQIGNGLEHGSKWAS
jgi:hypothetical protein